jgi:hypothetical protein
MSDTDSDGGNPLQSGDDSGSNDGTTFSRSKAPFTDETTMNMIIYGSDTMLVDTLEFPGARLPQPTSNKATATEYDDRVSDSNDSIVAAPSITPPSGTSITKLRASARAVIASAKALLRRQSSKKGTRTQRRARLANHLDTSNFIVVDRKLRRQLDCSYSHVDIHILRHRLTIFCKENDSLSSPVTVDERPDMDRYACLEFGSDAEV